MDDFKAIVETQIKTRILEAFKDGNEYVEALVASALNKEVNEHGGEPSFHSHKKMPYLDYIVGEQIRLVSQQCVREVIAERQPQIKEAISKRLSADDVVTAFTATMLASMKEDWKITVNFEAEKHDH